MRLVIPSGAFRPLYGSRPQFRTHNEGLGIAVPETVSIRPHKVGLSIAVP